ncbi:MAG: hypothetical protein ABI624_02560 [Casimicrobiaceae bacterium]
MSPPGRPKGEHPERAARRLPMTLRVGSAPWLLRHELLLALRSLGGSGFWLLVVLGGLGFVVMHFMAWGMLLHFDPDAPSASTTLLFGTLAWVVVTLMFAQAIMMSVDALFERGDFDLLLASPIEPRVVFLVRSLGIALACVLLYLFLLAPFADVGLVTSRPQLVAIFPALLALGLLVTAAAMALTLALVRWLGARRARTAAQIVGAVMGASLFLVFQVPALVGHEFNRQVTAMFRSWTEPGQPLAPSSLVWLPFHALLGHPLALLAVVVAGVGGLWLVANLACKRFLAGTQASVTGIAVPAPAARRTSFHAGLLRNVLVKEWKLIWRDPSLIAQTLLQALYLLPVVFIAIRRGDGAVFAAPVCILLAASLAGNLAWLTVAAEDAPELIGAAPVRLATLGWMKVLAAVAPVWVLVSPVMVYLAAVRPYAAAVFVFCLAGATLSAGIMQVWYPQRGRRADFKRRMQSSRLITMLEALGGFAWTGIAWLLLTEPMYALLVAPLTLIGPGVAWTLGAARRNGGVAMW